ncbi:recombinase family protein [Hafnia alvei]|uniref:recombinase family protein n=1 Tax=Hafnia alvei TaxID=569 RepID=UPI000B641263|nr:recombinase family protein [Hafnia alvei]MBI0276753.1 recombinase family protein [Hafnia alvei]PNK99802.1 resolvase [Hafnia alvei]
MSRTFAYCRVSTTEQDSSTQLLAIRNAGYGVPDNRAIEETISGGVMAMTRPAFSSMVEHKLEAGDTLVVLKLDRLGRDNIDVQNTVSLLMDRGVKVVSLDLPVRDLASAEGKLLLQMFSAFAEFEKSRIIERTQEGIARARAEGKTLGRPKISHDAGLLAELVDAGKSAAQISVSLGVSRATAARLAKAYRENQKANLTA